MAIYAEESLRLALCSGPLSPCDLIGIDLPKLYQAFCLREHGDFIYGVESAPVAQEIDRKQKEARAQGEGAIAVLGMSRREMHGHSSANDNVDDMFCQRLGEASRVGQGETTFKLLVKDLEGRKVPSAEPPVGQPTDDGVVFSTRFPLPPGSYVVRVAMMDGTGRTGSVDHRVDVRQESLGDIQATGPILVRVPTDPQRRPSLALSDTRQDEKLAMQVHLRGEESRLANPDVTFEIAGSADGPALVEAPADVSSRLPGGWVVGQAVADLRVLPPGPYVVRARVTADGLPLGQVHRAFVVAGAAATSVRTAIRSW